MSWAQAGQHLKLSSDILVPMQIPNEFLSFRDTKTESRHPIRLYSRYINKVSCPCQPSVLGPSCLTAAYALANLI